MVHDVLITFQVARDPSLLRTSRSYAPRTISVVNELEVNA